MKIIIKLKNNLEKIIDCSFLKMSEADWRITFSNISAVKELEFSNMFYENNIIPIFNEIYEELKVLPYPDIIEVILYFNDKQQFSFKSPMQDICYRNSGYSCGGSYKVQERLSFKFKEDSECIFNIKDNKVYCSEKCSHKKNNYCYKYKTNLNTNLVCKSCFLENQNYYFNEIKSIFYDNMIGELN